VRFVVCRSLNPHGDLFCADVPLQCKPAFSAAKLAENAADRAQTVDKAGGSFAIDCAREIRLTVEQRSTGRARAIIAVPMRPRLPPLAPPIVDVVAPLHGATDQDHPDQIDDQTLDVHCFGHHVHIASPSRARIARGYKPVPIATFCIPAPFFFARAHTNIVGLQLDLGDNYYGRRLFTHDK
jgi:hypothetical protein